MCSVIPFLNNIFSCYHLPILFIVGICSVFVFIFHKCGRMVIQWGMIANINKAVNCGDDDNDEVRQKLMPGLSIFSFNLFMFVFTLTKPFRKTISNFFTKPVFFPLWFFIRRMSINYLHQLSNTCEHFIDWKNVHVYRIRKSRCAG